MVREWVLNGTSVMHQLSQEISLLENVLFHRIVEVIMENEGVSLGKNFLYFKDSSRKLQALNFKTY